MKVIDLDRLLPGAIPSGEQVLWRGRPHWVSLARRAFRADFVAGWFVLMALWNFASTMADASAWEASLAALRTLGAGALALALLFGLGWLSARTTLYVVTTRRVVMKIGMALPVFYNLPFGSIESASLRTYGDGTGDIPLVLGDKDRIAWLHLWPHARPFRFAKPEPALRCVPRAGDVAETLGRALIAAANEGVVEPVTQSRPEPRPVAARHRGDAIAAA